IRDLHVTGVQTCALPILINNMAVAQSKEVPQKVKRPQVENQVKTINGGTPLSPKTLWELGRVSAEGLSADGTQLIYGVSNYQFEIGRASCRERVELAGVD